MKRVLLSLVLAACGRETWTPAELGLGSSNLEWKRLEKGRQSYATYCAGCHGEQGDGNGPAARFLDPRPRDFRKGLVKFAAVPAGTTPRDEDLMQTITHGLSGTAMPAWNLIPLEERRGLIAYLRTFYPGWSKAQPGTAIATGDDPFQRDPQKGIAEGERLYHGMAACWNCHPAYVARAKIAAYAASYKLPPPGLRPDLYQSATKDSDWGAPIRAPAFHTDPIKNGTTPADLVRVIAAGVGGTAMPTWGSGLTQEQLWGLAHYVTSIAARRGQPEMTAQLVQLDKEP